MRLFNEGAELPRRVRLILSENVFLMKLEVFFGWNVRRKIVVGKRRSYDPIMIALNYNKKKSIKFLVNQGVRIEGLNNPILPAAADSCDIETISWLIEKGASIHSRNHVGSSAVSRAYTNKRYDLMLWFYDNGFAIDEDLTILRKASSDGNYDVVKMLLDLGVKPNKFRKSMVYPYNPSPILQAARGNHDAVVKLLVEYGADITLKDAYGFRPYTVAKENNNIELMNFLKSMEPAEWHDVEEKILELKKYNLPKALVQLLCSDNRRVQLSGQDFVTFIEFKTITDVQLNVYQGVKYLDLVHDLDNYSNAGFLVWLPSKRKISSIDYEHGEMRVLGSWRDFRKNPDEYIEKIFSNENVIHI